MEESKTVLSETRSAYSEAQSLSKQKYNSVNNSLRDEIQKCEFEINSTLFKLNTVEKDIKNLELERDKLREEYKTTAQSEYTGQTEWTGDTVCPLCKQELPCDSLEEQKVNFYNTLKDKKEAFNKSKSENLENINVKGKALTANINIKKSEQAEYNAAILMSQSKKSDLETQLKEREDTANFIPFEQTSEYERLHAVVKGLEINLASAEKVDTDSFAETRIEISEIQKTIDALLNEKAMYTLAKKQDERVEELKSEEKRIAKECEHYKKVLYLCDEFIKFKVSIATETINERFCNIRFRLFKEQINGGLEEICEALVNTDSGYQPYLNGSANEAARINADLEIAGVLGKHYNIILPIFLDRAESVSKPIKPNGRQLIRMAVVPGIKELEIIIEKSDDIETA